MRRARSDEEKRERRDGILAVALGMYEAAPSFGAFTMAGLAERAGLAKGTLYLYFRSKEELFLALLEALLGEWFDEIDTRTGADAAAWDAAHAAGVLAESVRGRTTLARLLTILGTILEHNVDHDTALAFKRSLLARVAATGAGLERRLPFLGAGEGARLLLHLHALVVGLWQMAEPSPTVARILAAPEMAAGRVSFDRDLRDVLDALLAGRERLSRGDAPDGGDGQRTMA